MKLRQEGRVRFREWSDIWPLLVCMTVRKCKSKKKALLTKKRNVNREVLMTELTEKNGFAFDAEQHEPSPESVLIFEETLEEFLEAMTDIQRQAVWMKIEGYSADEIAVRLGRTERTIFRTLAIAKERISAMFANNG